MIAPNTISPAMDVAMMTIVKSSLELLEFRPTSTALSSMYIHMKNVNTHK